MTTDYTRHNEGYATPDEIKEIIDLMEPVLAPRPVHTVLIATIALAFIIQHPQISAEGLLNGVDQASRYIAELVEADIIQNSSAESDIVAVPGSNMVN